MTANTANTPADVQTAIAAISATDKEVQGAAFQFLMRETEQPVAWGHAVWDDLISVLDHKDNRTRAIAGQLLCNLAKSDSDARLERDLTRIFAVTFDERFVTARHVLLALWKAGVHSLNVRTDLVRMLAERFAVCVNEKNGTLVRYDILCTLRTLYDRTGDDEVRKVALMLIPLETDPKYRRKYASAWRGVAHDGTAGNQAIPAGRLGRRGVMPRRRLASRTMTAQEITARSSRAGLNSRPHI